MGKKLLSFIAVLALSITTLAAVNPPKTSAATIDCTKQHPNGTSLAWCTSGLEAGSGRAMYAQQSCTINGTTFIQKGNVVYRNNTASQTAACKGLQRNMTVIVYRYV